MVEPAAQLLAALAGQGQHAPQDPSQGGPVGALGQLSEQRLQRRPGLLVALGGRHHGRDHRLPLLERALAGAWRLVGQLAGQTQHLGQRLLAAGGRAGQPGDQLDESHALDPLHLPVER
jgi:hypothetical protein